MNRTKIVANWNLKQVQQSIIANLTQKPAEHPSAFNSYLAPQDLNLVSKISQTNEEFLATVTEFQLGEMLDRYATEYSTIDQDSYEFSFFDFVNDCNKALYEEQVGPVTFHIIKANRGLLTTEVTMCFTTSHAEDLLDKLSVSYASNITLTRHREGVWTLKVDKDFFVIEDVKSKVAKDLSRMSEFEKESLACKIGVEVSDLAERLQVWFKEVGYAPY